MKTNELQIKDERLKYEGFKLVSLNIRNNPLLCKSNLDYNFIEPGDLQESIYTTVLIGPNGTGKSNLFRIIIDLFKELCDLSKKKPQSNSIAGSFNLKYSVNGDIFEFGNIPELNSFIGKVVLKNRTDNYLKKNGFKIDFKDAQFPLAIIANSISITDKFPFYQKDTTSNGEKIDAFKQYKYLGVRNIAQNASTRAYVRKTVEFVVQEFKNPAFRNGLLRATNFLELENVIKIIYNTTNTSRFFNGKLNATILEEYFNLIKEKYPRPENNPPFKLNQYFKIKKDDKTLIDRICNFCNNLYNENRLIKSEHKYKSNRKIIYNLFDSVSFKQLNEDYLMLENLRQLGLVSAPEIQLVRGDSFSLQESSSGEYHFFSAIVGLMATVKINSLVLIDEPEISLHPNWQMKYMSFMRDLFSDPLYAESHILIATHSHFLISDLKGGNSKIIGLKRDNNRIEIVNLPENIDTYGWSAEEVLYSVFNVRSTRNSFLEFDLTKLVTLVNRNSNDYDEIKRILNKISGLVLSDNDPLKILKEKAEKYLEVKNA